MSFGWDVTAAVAVVGASAAVATGAAAGSHYCWGSNMWETWCLGLALFLSMPCGCDLSMAGWQSLPHSEESSELGR